MTGGGWPVRGSHLDRTRNKQFCRENLRTLAGIAGDGVRYVELEWRAVVAPLALIGRIGEGNASQQVGPRVRTERNRGPASSNRRPHAVGRFQLAHMCRYALPQLRVRGW